MQSIQGHSGSVYSHKRAIISYVITAPVPVTARSKELVCGRSLAGTAGSNPVGGHGFLSLVSVVCRQVEISATG
jgi:hypothetical protein